VGQPQGRSRTATVLQRDSHRGAEGCPRAKDTVEQPQGHKGTATGAQGQLQRMQSDSHRGAEGQPQGRQGDSHSGAEGKLI
jgi:hypothetical protein